MLNTDTLAQDLVTAITGGLDGKTSYEGAGLFDRYQDAGFPRNAATSNCYTGRNVLELWVAQADRSFATGEWMTYKQAEGMGGQVRKGERGTPIVRVVRFVPEKEKAAAARECRKPIARKAVKGYTVFNVLQIDGICPCVEQAPEFVPEERAQQMVNALIERAGLVIRHGYNACFYTPGRDEISLPDLCRFKSVANYHKTIFHEIAHWTGHESRLDRLKPFTDRECPEYCTEELVADLCSAMLCAHLGLSGARLESHACYLNAYLKLLKAQPELIFSVATEAQRAANYALQAAGLTTMGGFQAGEVDEAVA